MADSSGVFVRRSSEESRHYSWHFPSTFAVTIITALEIKCAVEGRGRHSRDGADLPVISEASFVFARPVRKNGAQVRLYSRPGNDFTRRFPLIVEALRRLRSRSCITDGEAVARGENGIASFDLIWHHRANDSVFLYAFGLIELNGDDLRRDPLEVRKATLASIVAKARPAIRVTPETRATKADRDKLTKADSLRKISAEHALAGAEPGASLPVASMRGFPGRLVGKRLACGRVRGETISADRRARDPASTSRRARPKRDI